MTVETLDPPPTQRQNNVARQYSTVAILLLNTLLLFVFVNVICWLALEIHMSRERPAYLTHSDDYYRSIYAPMPDSEWKELLRESRDRSFGFQPYTMFTEPAYQGRYVNVSPQGFRVNPQQGPWPMDPRNFNVLTFGNSTMFGYAVADDQTVPAYLQALLQKGQDRRVCVYNFGRRAYFSTQERILYEQLLRDGARPNLAVFMDGPADFLFAVEPAFVQQSQDELLAPRSAATLLVELWQKLPAGQITQLLARKFVPPKPAPSPDPNVVDPIAIDRYAWNKKSIEAISAADGITTAFIFQPTPVYGNPLEFQKHEWDAPGDQCAVKGYPLMAKYVNDHNMGDDFLWLADIPVRHPMSYIDKWHYSADFSSDIAAEICKFLLKRQESR